MTTIIGRAGRAERCKLVPKTPAQAANLASWPIEAPGQSPAWSHYLLSVAHLRPMPGVDPPAKQFPEAEHEILLVALDPAIGPRADDQETWHHLIPANAAVQFGGATDEEAVRVLDLAAKAVCDGVLPAEPAFPRRGQEVWKRAIQETAAHVVFGGHGRAAG
jgi:hypothetical protein